MIKIVTDATNDLSVDFLKTNDIELIPMELNVDGKVLIDDKTLNLQDFYNGLRKGKMPTTSMINPTIYEEVFEKYLKNGNDILYIGFSSALSGCFNASLLAKNTLEAKYENKVHCFDTKSASMGMGILTIKALEYIKNGDNIDTIINKLSDLRERICILLGVDNLFHLERGGRISKALAVIGTTLQLKPVIKVNEEGKLINFKKVMGKKKLIQTFYDYFVKFHDETELDNVYVISMDSSKDANELKNKLDTNFNINSKIVELGTIVGTHTGADALAIIFVSKETKTNIK